MWRESRNQGLLPQFFVDFLQARVPTDRQKPLQSLFRTQFRLPYRANMSSPSEEADRKKLPLKVELVQCFVHLLVILLLASEGVPGVNESHYLTKAKHSWDSGFARGDLFLESHNSHFLAGVLAGAAAHVAPLPVVAWGGRLLSWSLFAVAWTLLSRNLRIPRLISPFALAAWYLAVRYGHWSGEWAIGGFEAKSIAYPCVLIGLSAMVAGQWQKVWVWMGLAVALHPVVGGWAGLSVGLVWLVQPELKDRYVGQLRWLACGALIGLVGVIPAASGLSGPDREGGVVASQVHVFMRLAHHMCPRAFAVQRHWAGGASLLALIVVTMLWRALGSGQRHVQGGSRGTGLLLQCAWVSVLFSLMGWAIDQFLAPSRPDIASKLLRFYWFRWSDVAVPLVWTLTAWQICLSLRQSPRKDRSESAYGPAVSLGVLATLLVGVGHVRARWNDSIPAADKLVVDSVGPNQVATDRYVDWLAVCRWIRENAPEDSLWLTPKYQQTFKWHAGRAEVVCWKDVPQDNASVLEWYRRIQGCEPPRDPTGKVRQWTTEEVLELSAEYGFRWILVDRTVQTKPLNLEIMYPINIENRSFAVFRISDGFIGEPGSRP